MNVPITNNVQASISFNGTGFDYKNIVITLNKKGTKTKKSIDEIGKSISTESTRVLFTTQNIPENSSIFNIEYKKISLISFPLENLDQMRENILKNTGANKEFVIDETEPLEPYATWASRIGNNLKTTTPLCGLAIKTYQSDIFNNWINTEWLDGEGGINEITAIDVSSGSFTMDLS